ncbi:radical SAM protein [Patescibacteria group bacterium]|nr:radical SAM protein [Patescibacteria group bacterium]
MSFYYSLFKLKQELFLKNFGILFQLGKINSPTSVVWDSTRRCNLDCIHCGSQGNYEKELSLEEIINILGQLSLFGVKNFQITGGEPLLRADFIEVLAYANEKGLITSFATNGYYIDENKAKSISKANVSLIQISIDGTKDIHNSIRKNPKSFSKAVNAIKLLKSHSDSKISVATTVMPQNINSLAQLRGILISLDIDLWNIGTVMSVGKAKNNPSLFLSKEQFNRLINFIIDSKKEINIEIGENFPYLGKFDKKIRRTPKMCPIGILSCCIGVDGHVRGCPDQPDTDLYREGRIQTETFEEIWKKGFKRYRNRRIIEEDKKCFICNHRTDCWGGCWVMRENNSQCILDYI